ncbi:MAG: DUF2612 domain-containing protein [bacterium]|nr:DUF2612 domain-containing protein [bacterium]
MQAEKITTHVIDALKRFIEQYKNSSKLQGITASFCNQIQDIENALCSLYGRLDIDNITGNDLDNIGKIVGQDRLGFTDDIYRILIYTRIAINVSGGIPENIISIFQILTQCTEVEFLEIFPAGVHIMANLEIDSSLTDYIKEALESSLAAGVTLSGVGYYDPTNAFTFTDGTPEVDSEHGFGDTGDALEGGLLSVVL